MISQAQTHIHLILLWLMSLDVKKNNSNTFGVKVKRAQLSDPAELFVVPKMKSGINFDEDERT